MNDRIQSCSFEAGAAPDAQPKQRCTECNGTGVQINDHVLPCPKCNNTQYSGQEKAAPEYGLMAQHARDSAELRRLCAWRDQLKAELADTQRRLKESTDVLFPVLDYARTAVDAKLGQSITEVLVAEHAKFKAEVERLNQWQEEVRNGSELLRQRDAAQQEAEALRAQLAAKRVVPKEWRDLAGQAAEALQVFTGHDSSPNLRHRYGEKWWEPINELRDKLARLNKGAK